ncbi:MAG: serine/threonine-protein kinase [Anaerolineae bacterium]|nr:serine/threonine-protein kinase [Anaerolineae bacterium]
MMDLKPDSLLNNRYRITRQLGKGGMGAVYLAYDVALEHEVALKTNLKSSEEGTAQFLREARLLARLRHANLPRVIDYFLSEDIQCLVMDYIPGSDLRDVLKQQGAQPLERVLAWATQLASALSYLHHQDPPVIHRDIKPANIKLTLEGEAVLVDFGIAKTADQSQATSTGASGYTPGFAPPEQYGSGRTGPYTDQFALAATLYMLLCNHQPADAVQRALGEAVLTPLTAIRPDLPAALQSVLERAMAVKPEERFASVDAFISALQQSVQPGVTLQPPAQPPSPTRPPARSGSSSFPLWVFPAGIVFILLVLGAAGWLVFTRLSTFAVNKTPVPLVMNTSAAITSSPGTISTALPTAAEITATPQPPADTPTAAPTATLAANYLGNGKLIVFVSDRADGKTMQLWSMKAVLNSDNSLGASNLQQITFDEGNKQDPSWSPDGRWLLYAAPGPAGNGLDIWKVDTTVEKSQPIRLSNFPGDDKQPSWSPDGKTIVFTNFGRYNEINQLYFMDIDGGGIKRISLDFDETQAGWSPDQEWLFYVINAQSHSYFYMRNRKDDYATPQAYDNVEIFGRLGEVSDPAWSRDGAYIAYTRTEGLTQRVYSVPFKSRGAEAALLTQGAFKENEPTWSPDGQWLAFTSQRDDNSEIYIMTSAGLLTSNLSQSPGIDRQPVWQP